jgi:hypothetical protein
MQIERPKSGVKLKHHANPESEIRNPKSPAGVTAGRGPVSV